MSLSNYLQKSSLERPRSNGDFAASRVKSSTSLPSQPTFHNQRARKQGRAHTNYFLTNMDIYPLVAAATPDRFHYVGVQKPSPEGREWLTVQT